MHFRGNQFTGIWTWKDGAGKQHTIAPSEILENSRIHWLQTPDSGDFLWPHIEREKGIYEALDYNE